MESMLDEIADLLRTSGLTIDPRPGPGDPITQIWDVSDMPAETVIRVMILRDINGNPDIWTPAFAGYAAKYIVPIVTRIGDARDQVIQRHNDTR